MLTLEELDFKYHALHRRRNQLLEELVAIANKIEAIDREIAVVRGNQLDLDRNRDR